MSTSFARSAAPIASQSFTATNGSAVRCSKWCSTHSDSLTRERPKRLTKKPAPLACDPPAACYKERVSADESSSFPADQRVECAATPDAEPWRWCPRCAHELHNEKCKLRCPRCHYFMSCSDFD